MRTREQKYAAIYRDSCAPAECVIARYDDKADAVRCATREGAHVHEQESETGPGAVWFVCECPR